MDVETVNDGAPDDQYRTVLCDASRIVDVARSAAVRSVNAAMTAAYRMIGQRIVAAYGAAFVARLATDLTQRFGRGSSRQDIQMRQFYFSFRMDQICQTPSGKSACSPMNEFSRRCLENLNPPEGSIFYAQKNTAVARYALDGLPIQVLAAEYQTALPDEELLAPEIARARDAMCRRGLPPAGESS